MLLWSGALSQLSHVISLSQVTFIEALDGLMPGFDPEIGKMAQRLLIQPRNIDYHTGVLAKKVSMAAKAQWTHTENDTP